MLPRLLHGLSGQLIFDSASAGDIAEEFNRYNSRHMISMAILLGCV